MHSSSRPGGGLHQAPPPPSRHPPEAAIPREQAPPNCGQTHACKHITLPQTSFAGDNKRNWGLLKYVNQSWTRVFLSGLKCNTLTLHNLCGNCSHFHVNFIDVLMREIWIVWIKTPNLVFSDKKFFSVKSVNLLCHARADPGFPMGATIPKTGVANLLFDQFFRKTGWKGRKIGQGGSANPKFYYVDPPLDVTFREQGNYRKPVMSSVCVLRPVFAFCVLRHVRRKKNVRRHGKHGI